MSGHDPYAALKVRDFRLFLLGNVFATVGMEMQSVAVGWELYERTHAPIALGLTGLAQFLPMVLVTIPAGQLADVRDRRRILMTALGVMTLSSLGLAAVSIAHAPVQWMYALLVLAGIGRAVRFPAYQALSPQLVPRELYANAATWRSSGFQLAAMLGPATGGAVIAATKGASLAYFLCAAASLVFILLLSMVTHRSGPGSKQAPSFESVVAGIRFVFRTKPLLASITLDLFAVLLGGATALLPVFAKDVLHVGPRGLGTLMAAPSVGALIAAVLIAHRPPLQRAGRTLMAAVAGFGVSTIVFGLSRNFFLSLAALFMVGAFDSISVVIRSTLVQIITPDDMRGRVSAVNSLFIGTSNELGAFESGAVAQVLGPVGSVVVGGVGTLVVVGAVAAGMPDVRRIGALQDLAPPMVPDEEEAGAGPAR